MPAMNTHSSGKFSPGKWIETETGEPTFKFLREPQFLALETYWYVRLKFRTPHILDLYKRYYGHDKKIFFDSLGI